MSTLKRPGAGLLIFGATALAVASCATDARDFLPADGGEGGEGGLGGSSPSAGGSGGGSATGGHGSGTGGNDGTGGGSNGTGGGTGGQDGCTDDLPGGDRCGGDCDPCPDGYSCDTEDDCTGDVCTSGGECCTTVPEADLCQGKCGTLDSCGMDVECSACVGEATCSSENLCGCPAAPCAIFSASFGDANQQYIGGLAVDGAGNVYLAGDFRGTLVFGEDTLTSVGAAQDDMFLVKFDPAGVPIWAKSFGDASDQEATGVAVDGSGNVILIGRSSGTINFGGTDLVTDSDMVIAKFNAAGAHQFSEQYGDDNVNATAVAADIATGEIVVVGYFWGDLKFGSLSNMISAGTYGYFDTFMVRFSPVGVPQSSKRVGSSYDELAESAAVVGSYAYVAGTFKDLLDFGSPNPTPLTSTGWSDLYVAKLGKSTFSHGWSKRFGDDGANGYAVDTPRIVVDPASGDALIAGNFTGTMEFTPALTTTGYEMFLARLDGDDGSSVWAKQFQNAELGATAFGPNGMLYVAGRATGDIDLGGGPRPWSGTHDVFIAKFALNGDHIYSRVFASPTGVQFAQEVAVTQNGEAWIAARFDGQLDLGLGPLQAQGGYDVAIGKYAP